MKEGGCPAKDNRRMPNGRNGMKEGGCPAKDNRLFDWYV